MDMKKDFLRKRIRPYTAQKRTGVPAARSMKKSLSDNKRYHTAPAINAALHGRFFLPAMQFFLFIFTNFFAHKTEFL
jgi:hypothetical protein